MWDTSSTAVRSLRGQRFASSGAAIAGEFEVTAGVTDGAYAHSLAADPDGDFVVAWENRDDGDLDGIEARRFDSSGQPAGDIFQVNNYTTGRQSDSDVAVDADGDFIITWASFGDEVDTDRFSIQARRYASDGTTIDGPFLVNSYTPDAQLWPSVAIDGYGDFVVAWTDYRDDLGDTSSRSINAQRFRVTADIGDRAFLDLGVDGVQSIGDTGLEGVTVGLRDVVSGALLMETVTDANGLFLFKPKIGTSDAVDQFALEFAIPSGAAFTLPNVGGDETIDSDVDPGSGLTEAVIFTSPGESDLDLDAGFQEAIFADNFESGDTSAWSGGSP